MFLFLARFFILVLLFFCFSSYGQFSSLETETLRRQALDAYSNENYEASEKYFLKLISLDPQSPSAQFSLNYLQKLFAKSGMIDDAIKKYTFLKQKNIGLKEEDLVNPLKMDVDGHFLKNGGILEHLSKVFTLTGFSAAHIYLLSFALNAEGYSEQAAYYLNEAKEEESHLTSNQRTLNILKSIFLPLSFKKSFYESYYLGAKKITFFEFFQSRFKDIPKNTSWHPLGRLLFQREYFLNPQEQPSSEKTLAWFFNFSAGLDSPQINSFLFSFRYQFMNRNYSKNHFSSSDYLTHSLSSSVSKIFERTEAKLKIDYYLTLKNRNDFKRHITAIEPHVQILRAWSKSQTLLEYSLLKKTFQETALDYETSRTGLHHFFKAKHILLHSLVYEPSFSFVFGYDKTNETNLRSIENGIVMELTRFINDNFLFNIETSLSLLRYPSQSSRVDWSNGTFFTLSGVFNSFLFNYFIRGGYEQQSSSLSSKGFKNFSAHAGLELSFY